MDGLLFQDSYRLPASPGTSLTAQPSFLEIRLLTHETVVSGERSAGTLPGTLLRIASHSYNFLAWHRGSWTSRFTTQQKNRNFPETIILSFLWISLLITFLPPFLFYGSFLLNGVFLRLLASRAAFLGNNFQALPQRYQR